MGGKHATFNMALWDGEFAASATAADLDALMAAIRAQSAADVLALHQQPLRWRELANPMAMLPHQASVNDCPLMPMAPGARAGGADQQFDARAAEGQGAQAEGAARLSLSRGRQRRRDQAAARLRSSAIKPLRMAEQKLPNVFAEPGVEDFIRDACLARLAGGGHAIDIHALECDDEVIAIFAGVADGHRFSMMFNTYTMSENAKLQPGPDPDARHRRSLCRPRLSRARSRHRLGRLQAAVLQERRADLRQFHRRSPRAENSPPPRCPASTAPSTW